MPGGDVFSDVQRQEIMRAVADAERDTGWVFAIEIGSSDAQTRAYAVTLHSRLTDPARSILIQVDPERRTLEIITGQHVRRALDNRSAGLAAVTMQSAFAAGDLSRGLVAGVRQLAELSRTDKSLHTDTP